MLMALLLGGFSNTLSAQISLSGKVIDTGTSEPLIGARVFVPDLRVGTQTDMNGDFELTVRSASSFELFVTFFGYDTIQQQITASARGLVLGLSPSDYAIGEVEITASASVERQKQAALTVESMSINAIKETPAANFYEGLGHLKGVDLTSASLGFKVINTRGFNSTSPVRSLQIIDGVDNQSPGLNFSLGNFLGASELDIESVDLVVGASSAFYGPNAFNGVISMNTRNPFIHQGISASIKGGSETWLKPRSAMPKPFRIKTGKTALLSS
jgi:iron complex outermembrane receptor protein